MLDITLLAGTLASTLAPALPSLLKAGDKALEEVGGKLGDAAWERAKRIWNSLRPTIDARPAAAEAVQDVATNPDDPVPRASFENQLRKLLSGDQALAAELARILAERPAQGGNRGQVHNGALAQGTGAMAATDGGVVVGGGGVVHGDISTQNHTAGPDWAK